MSSLQPSYVDFRPAALQLHESSVEFNGYASGPERRLLAAVLFDGIQAFMAYARAASKTQRVKYREAYSWVVQASSEYVFDFDNVCEALGIEPTALRLGLLNAVNSRSKHWKRGRRNF